MCCYYFFLYFFFFFFSSRRRHTRLVSDWSSDVCSSDLERSQGLGGRRAQDRQGRREQGRSRGDQEEVRGGRRQGGDQVIFGFAFDSSFRTGAAFRARGRARGHQLRTLKLGIFTTPSVPKGTPVAVCAMTSRSEEHTSELQSLTNL